MSTVLLLLLAGCQEKALTVYNTAPTVSILSPADGEGRNPGELVEFFGVARDQQSDSDELVVAWSSSLDGDLWSEPPDVNGDVYSATNELSSGTHTITLAAVDEQGESASASILLEIAPGSNTAGTPTVVILGPTEGQTFGSAEAINLIAAVTDPEDAEETLSVELIDVPDGSVWTGTPTATGSLTVTLDPTEGTHSLTLNATDADGNVGTATVNYTVLADSRPTATILTPADSSVWSTDDLISFRGVITDDATDVEDLSVVWASDVSGIFGINAADSSGAVSSAITLSEGFHTITLTTVDGDGQSGSDSIVIQVEDPSNIDDDGDGYTENEGDCDDADATTYPAATDTCDLVDNNCDGVVNEPYLDAYEENDSAYGYDCGEVDSSWLWTSSSLTLSSLTLSDPDDEDWFSWTADDEYYDNVSIIVTVTGLPAAGDYALQIYNRDTGRVEDSDSGSASLSVRYDGDLLDDDEDNWAIRLYANTWPAGSCSTTFTMTVSS